MDCARHERRASPLEMEFDGDDMSSSNESQSELAKLANSSANATPPSSPES
jgi:hypothetical protein